MESVQPSTPDTETHENYLTFRLGTEVLAIAMASISEVVPYESVTPIPLTPPWLRGVFNLRGQVLPAIDLGVRLGLPRCEPGKRTCLFVLAIAIEGLALRASILVDEVLELLELRPSDIEAPPEFGGGIKVEFLRGLHQRASGTLLLVDAVRVFERDELLEVALHHQRLRATRTPADTLPTTPRASPLASSPLQPSAAQDSEESCVHLFDDSE